ncbi:MAG: hypothetical protein U0800_03200 [Isosphaeraceae bacterium]
MQSAWLLQASLEVATHRRPTEGASRATTILGLDLGQFKGVAGTYDTDEAEARRASFRTDPDPLREWPERGRPDLVLFET